MKGREIEPKDRLKKAIRDGDKGEIALACKELDAEHNKNPSSVTDINEELILHAIENNLVARKIGIIEVKLIIDTILKIRKTLSLDLLTKTLKKDLNDELFQTIFQTVCDSGSPMPLSLLETAIHQGYGTHYDFDFIVKQTLKRNYIQELSSMILKSRIMQTATENMDSTKLELEQIENLIMLSLRKAKSTESIIAILNLATEFNITLSNQIIQAIIKHPSSEELLPTIKKMVATINSEIDETTLKKAIMEKNVSYTDMLLDLFEKQKKPISIEIINLILKTFTLKAIPEKILTRLILDETITTKLNFDTVLLTMEHSYASDLFPLLTRAFFTTGSQLSDEDVKKIIAEKNRYYIEAFLSLCQIQNHSLSEEIVTNVLKEYRSSAKPSQLALDTYVAAKGQLSEKILQKITEHPRHDELAPIFINHLRNPTQQTSEDVLRKMLATAINERSIILTRGILKLLKEKNMVLTEELVLSILKKFIAEPKLEFFSMALENIMNKKITTNKKILEAIQDDPWSNELYKIVKKVEAAQSISAATHLQTMGLHGQQTAPNSGEGSSSSATYTKMPGKEK